MAQSRGPSRARLIRACGSQAAVTTCCARSIKGIRGCLVADTGLLELLADMQPTGNPGVVVWKVSPCSRANPLTVAEQTAGRSTINVPADITLGQLAEMRSVTSLPLDLYVEAPTSMGGVVRGHESADLVAVASPMYVKFGLRNSRPLYPSGLHLADEAAAIAREKVHRARVALEWMQRSGLGLGQSQPGAPGLGVPNP